MRRPDEGLILQPVRVFARPRPKADIRSQGLLPRKMTIRPPFRWSQIPAVITNRVGVVLSLGAGNATPRFHRSNCWSSRRLAAHRASAANPDASDRLAKQRVAGCR